MERIIIRSDVMKPEVIHSKADCRNMSCPMPIVTLKKKLKELEIGQVIEMVATDPGSVPDVKGWSQQTGQELLYHEQIGKEYFFYIKKTK